MSRLIALATLLRGGGAVAWIGYTWLLAQWLSADALGVMLTLLALTNLGAGLLTAGWAQLVLRDGARLWATPHAGAVSDLVAQAAKGVGRRSVIMAVVAGALLGSLSLPALPADPVPRMLSIAAPVLLALVSILAAARRAQGALVPALLSQNVLRAVLPSVACLLYVQVAPLTLSATIWIYALGLVLCLPLAWPRLPAAQPYPLDRKALAGLSASQAGWMVFTHLDVLIVATVASAAEAALYLVARRLAGLLPLLFDALRSALAPGLSVAYHRKEGFGGLAARTNLGFFLIGGGAATALAVLGPLALAGFGPDFTAASGLLIWLTLGQAAPALFGATGMLMTMTDMERPRAVLVWIALPLGAGAQLFSAQHSLLALAIATAVMHLLFAAICAACLARRHGILPGLTALLHPKLRFKA